MCQSSSPRRKGFASASATGRLACTSSTEHLRPNAGAVHRHQLGQLLGPVVRLRHRRNGISLKEVFNEGPGSWQGGRDKRQGHRRSQRGNERQGQASGGKPQAHRSRHQRGRTLRRPICSSATRTDRSGKARVRYRPPCGWARRPVLFRSRCRLKNSLFSTGLAPT